MVQRKMAGDGGQPAVQLDWTLGCLYPRLISVREVRARRPNALLYRPGTYPGFQDVKAEQDHGSEPNGHCASDYSLPFTNVCLSSSRDRGSVKKAVDRPQDLGREHPPTMWLPGWVQQGQHL